MNNSCVVDNVSSCMQTSNHEPTFSKFIKRIKNNSTEIMLTLSIAATISGIALVTINPILGISLIVGGTLLGIGLGFCLGAYQKKSDGNKLIIQNNNKQEIERNKTDDINTISTSKVNIIAPPENKPEINTSPSFENKLNENIFNLLNNKATIILKAEHDALEKLNDSLDHKKSIQHQIKNLSMTQKRIFFPYLYIKLAHEKEILTAYDNHEINSFMSDLNLEDNTISDNINMIEATNFLLNVVDELDKKETRTSKIDYLNEKLLDVFSIVLTGKQSQTDFVDYIINNTVKMEWNYAQDFMYYDDSRFDFLKEEGKEETITLKKFSHEINMTKLYDCGFDILKYASKNTPESRLKNIKILSELLVDGYDKKDLKMIYDTCVDFMQTHILPNANVRASQVIMSVFFLALNKYPPSMIYESDFFGQPNSNISLDKLNLNMSLTKAKLDTIHYKEYNLLKVLTDEATKVKGKEPS